ncbi:hypothetical protein [Dokdonia sp. Hel_I_53]|uniref:hypothetical protein n=1 Tax=Dokdonia sp. Hel_I_53 TaxID=1566287 RepID=UPI00119980BC|nr:hypothetical protein [Dokdonia sp. Hel_I_53]TVZ52692.1 hypothetical protein OD90_1876 [Dokdonia sp. Hel_I_53]
MIPVFCVYGYTTSTCGDKGNHTGSVGVIQTLNTCDTIQDCTGCSGGGLGGSHNGTTYGSNNSGPSGGTTPISSDQIKYEAFKGELSRAAQDYIAGELALNTELYNILKQYRFGEEAKEKFSAILNMLGNPFTDLPFAQFESLVPINEVTLNRVLAYVIAIPTITIQEASVLTSIETFTGEILNEEQLSILRENPLFAQEVMEALEEGGEVDIEEKVILDPSISSNPKLNCVYNKLKELSSSFFSDVIDNHFDSAKNAHIMFIVKETPDGEDAFTKGIANGTDYRLFEIQINPSIIEDSSPIEIVLLFIHETIHAELLDRCVRLGLINTFNSEGFPNFTNTPNTFTTYDTIFALLVNKYKNYYIDHPTDSGESQWNHDLFTVLNYRENIVENLLEIHPSLNDPSDDFLFSVNNDPLNTFGDFNLEDLLNYVSWIGLEGTQEYISSISENPTELAKKNYSERAVRNQYTPDCVE